MNRSLAQDSAGGMVSSLALSPPLAVIALALGSVGGIVAIVFASGPVAAAGVLLAYALSWAAVVDVDRFILPDVITLGLVLAGLAVAYASGNAMVSNVIGAAAGYGALALVAAVYRRVRGRSGLGMGDAKLLSAAGAWLGWTALPGIMLVSSLAALGWAVCLFVHRGRASLAAPIPFGPFIALAFFVYWLFRS